MFDILYARTQIGYTRDMDERRDIPHNTAARGAHPQARASQMRWDGPAVGLLDLDAFFASVEQLDHPEWRGKPLIVGGDADKRGVVSTASYEARRYGVHSAMSSAQARRLCPDAIWTNGHYDRYREMSAKVMAIVLDETPYVEQVSIDEAFFDVTPGRFSDEDPVAIARRICARVAELGVTCSIGLSTNKTVAKIASERNKPNGLTVVYPGTEREFLAPIPVRAMSGSARAPRRRSSAWAYARSASWRRPTSTSSPRASGCSARASSSARRAGRSRACWSAAHRRT